MTSTGWSIPFTDTSLGLDYLSWPALAGLYALLAAPLVVMARGRLSGLGQGRKWFALSLRLVVLGVILLTLGGLRWERFPTDLDVIVLRDVSASVDHARGPGGRGVQESLERYVADVARRPGKPPADRVGVISFRSSAALDAPPEPSLAMGRAGVRDLGSGTDLARALDLALATLDRDTMHRILLAWDGNVTTGDVDAAVARVTAMRVPIDVMPLRYDLTREVIVDRLVAPSWRRQGETFSLDVVLRSTASEPVTGIVRVTDGGVALGAGGGAAAASLPVTLQPGPNVVRVSVPPDAAGGVHRFRAVFEADAPPVGRPAYDTVAANNSAEAITFVRGQGRVLFVDNTPSGESDALLAVLRREGIDVRADDHVVPASMPDDIVRLQDYDAVILANVPRGAGGLGESQQRALAAYVNDLGGGLVMIGGRDALGAGGWQGSALEQVLPVEMDVPARKTIPRGALMLVLDHSGSMGGSLGDRSKQEAVNEAAVLALRALSPQDIAGVVAFDAGFEWVAPLGPNVNADAVAQRMRALAPGGGTAIYPGLAAAAQALAALPVGEVSARHVLLLTDGQSTPGDYDTLINSMVGSGISLSTVGVGADHDAALLQRLAKLGQGKYYPVSDPTSLPQVFIRESRIVRRSLIKEDRRGIAVSASPSTSDWTAGLSFDRPVYGMVLTGRKAKPGVEVPLVAGPDNDPLLAHWQAGLGKVAVYTSDATGRWASAYVGGPQFGKFWSQVVRGVSRSPMSGDFDMRLELVGDRGRITVEALSAGNAFANFASVGGSVLGPDGKSQAVRLTQTAPGTYTGDFAAGDSGVYAVALNVAGKNVGGALRGGLVVNAATELRPLRSDEAAIRRVAARTGGRVLPAWDASSADVFTRDDLKPSPIPLPAWDLLVIAAMGLFLVDVAARRIALTWTDARRAAHAAASGVRGFTMTTRPVEAVATLAVLRTARDRSAATRLPDPSRKFDVHSSKPAVEDIIGFQATRSEPTRDAEGAMGGLLDAKRRARTRMDQQDDTQR